MKRLQIGPWLSILKIGFTAILIVSLGVYLKPGRLWEVGKQIDSGWMAAAGLLAIVGLAVQWVKWQQLLRFFRPQTTWSEGLQSLLVGFAFGLVSPGRLGELGRGVFLDGDRATWVGVAGVDRLCSQGVTLAAAWVGLLVIFPEAALGLILLAVVLALLVMVGLQAVTGRGEQWMWRVWEWVKQIPSILWARGTAWSILFNLVFFTQFYILVQSWGPLPDTVLWGIPVIFGLKSILPLSFMDLGVREGSAVLVFGLLGVDPAPAFNAALLIFVLNVLLPGACGVIFVFRHLGRGKDCQNSRLHSGVLFLTPWMTKG